MINTTSLFLAWRYLKPKGTFISWFIPLLAVLGPIVGVAVLIVVIAVMAGFSRDYREAMFRFQAHLELMMPDEKPIHDADTYIERLRTLGFKAAPEANGPAFVQTRHRLAAKMIRGIDPAAEQHVSKLKESIIRGKYEIEEDEVLIGNFLAMDFNLLIGDKIIVHPTGALREWIKFDENDEIVIEDPGKLYSPEELTVAGIYSIGMHLYDNEIIVTHIDKANEVFRSEWGDATVIKIWTDDPERAHEVRKTIGEDGGFGGLAAVTWMEKNAEFFRALAVEKNLQFFVLVFIVIVSSFSIAATLITIVIQKTREIGVLKALGATQRTILSVFLLQGAIVGLVGVGLGTAVGLLVVNYRGRIQEFIEWAFNISVFPPELYMLTVIPAHISKGDIIVIDAISFVICVLGAIIPAIYAVGLQPIRALQHDS